VLWLVTASPASIVASTLSATLAMLCHVTRSVDQERSDQFASMRTTVAVHGQKRPPPNAVP
jgi:hypothetical protein